MSELLDELARSVAKPMPRSRALRLVAGALVGVAFSGMRAMGARAFHTCPPKQLCECPAANGLFYKICCPEEYKCDCSIPKQATCIFVCPGNRKCGSKCCGVGSECADPDLEYCCEPRERACKGGGTVSCCKPSQYCCRGTCCEPRTRCAPGSGRGKCTPCPKGSRRCGKTCCTKGESCCGGKCCPKQEKCCPSDICCKKSETCCGPTCCNTDKQRCCDDHCCNKPKTCCGDGCCNKGRTCYQVQGKFSCCPDERLARTPAGKVCCPPLYYAEKDRCCPTGRACTPCDPPCPRGQYCQDGYCLQP